MVQVDERRPLAKQEVKGEKQADDYMDLIEQLDRYCDEKEQKESEGQGR